MDLENDKLPWYNQPKSNTTGFQLNGNYSNIYVTSSPMMDGLTLKQSKKISHFVNVSSTPFEMNTYIKEIDSQCHWFPTSELGFIGFNTLYGFIQTMEKIQKSKEKTIIHCEAGCNRSPSLTALWLMYQKPKTPTNQTEIINNIFPKGLDWKENLEKNIELELFPQYDDLNLFFTGIRNNRYLDDIIFNDYPDQLTKYVTRKNKL